MTISHPLARVSPWRLATSLTRPSAGLPDHYFHARPQSAAGIATGSRAGIAASRKV